MQALKPFSLKKLITLVLIAMLYLVVILSIIELGWVLYQDIVTPPFLVLEINELLDLLGLFLLVLVVVELLDTLAAYLDENSVHVEVVIEAAAIAVARKIIILDIKEVTPLGVIGLASLLLSLAVAYQLVRSGHTPTRSTLLARVLHRREAGEGLKSTQEEEA